MSYQKSDPLFSPIGMGTAGYEGLDKVDAIALLQYGIDCGLTHIDTAEMYGWGAVESLVGEAVRDRREGVFIGTKFWPVHASQQGVIAACDRSLQHLQTDYIDLYTLHWPSPFPLAETMDALLRLQDAGKIRHIGVSNFTIQHVQALQDLSYASDIFSNQVMYNLNERLAEQHVFAACKEAGIGIVGYSPLSGGKDFAQNEMLQNLADTYHKTPHQIALNFLGNSGEIALIPKTTKREQVLSLAQSLDFQLTMNERQTLSKSYPITGPQDSLSLPIDKNHYFRGNYETELQSLFTRHNLNPSVRFV